MNKKNITSNCNTMPPKQSVKSNTSSKMAKMTKPMLSESNKLDIKCIIKNNNKDNKNKNLSIIPTCKGIKSDKTNCTVKINLDKYPNGYCSRHQSQAPEHTRVERVVVQTKSQKIISHDDIFNKVKNVVFHLNEYKFNMNTDRYWLELSNNLNLMCWLKIMSYLDNKAIDALVLTNKIFGYGLIKTFRFYMTHPLKLRLFTPSLYKYPTYQILIKDVILKDKKCKLNEQEVYNELLISLERDDDITDKQWDKHCKDLAKSLIIEEEINNPYSQKKRSIKIFLSNYGIPNEYVAPIDDSLIVIRYGTPYIILRNNKQINIKNETQTYIFPYEDMTFEYSIKYSYVKVI